ncbi:hypothetical protein AGMMS50276_01160 [Synergistales bacterium]|nr:hypothetical protein AGMMS50276_01160 [Synergistales bacterium]
MHKKREPAVRIDLLWKELLESFLYSALEAFYPELYKLTDTTKKPVFLNKELRIPGSRKGQKIVDLLVDIHLKTGEIKCLLLHVEIQAKIRGESFNVRMYKYSCLIALRLSRPFVALAIRTTPKGNAEEIGYETRFLESESVYKYRTVFIDRLNEEELLNMKHNPLAISTLAAVRIAKAGRSEARRFEQAKEMIRLLKVYGFPLDVRMKVGFFIEGLANFSLERFLKKFEEEFEISCEEGGKDMTVTTPIVKRVLEKKARKWIRDEGKLEGKIEGKLEGKIEGKLEGKIEGKLEGKIEGAYEKALEVARSMLARNMPRDLISEVAGLSIEELNQLSAR